MPIPSPEPSSLPGNEGYLIGFIETASALVGLAITAAVILFQLLRNHFANKDQKPIVDRHTASPPSSITITPKKRNIEIVNGLRDIQNHAAGQAATQQQPNQTEQRNYSGPAMLNGIEVEADAPGRSG